MKNVHDAPLPIGDILRISQRLGLKLPAEFVGRYERQQNYADTNHDYRADKDWILVLQKDVVIEYKKKKEEASWD